jgi:hypothetical protein
MMSAELAIFSRSAEEEPATLTVAGGGRESKMCSSVSCVMRIYGDLCFVFILVSDIQIHARFGLI